MSRNIIETLRRGESKIASALIVAILSAVIITACSEPAQATPALPVHFLVPAETSTPLPSPTELDYLYELNHPSHTVLINCIDAIDMIPILDEPNHKITSPEPSAELLKLSQEQMMDISNPVYTPYISSTGSYILTNPEGYWTSGTLTRIPVDSSENSGTHLYIGPEHFINTTPEMLAAVRVDITTIDLEINRINPQSGQIESLTHTNIKDCRTIVATYPDGQIAAIATLIETTEESKPQDLLPYEGTVGGPCDLSRNQLTFGFNGDYVPALQTLSGPYYWNMGGHEYEQGYSIAFVEAEEGETIPGSSGGPVVTEGTQNFCGVNNFYTETMTEDGRQDLNSGFTILPDQYTMQYYIAAMSRDD